MRKKRRRWYVVIPDDGTEFYATAVEAEKAADEAMEYLADSAADDGWSEATGELEWGEAIPHGRCELLSSEPPEEGSRFDAIEHWGLRSVEPSPCGHPAACVVSTGEGTNHCGWCADKSPQMPTLLDMLYDIAGPLLPPRPADADPKALFAGTLAALVEHAVGARLSAVAHEALSRGASERAYRKGAEDARRLCAEVANSIATDLRENPQARMVSHRIAANIRALDVLRGSPKEKSDE